MKNYIKRLLFIPFIFPLFVLAQNSTLDPEMDSLQTLLLSQKRDSSKIKTLNEIAVIYKNNGQYNEALQVLDEAILNAERSGNEKEGSRSYVIKGSVYNHTRKHPEALTVLLKALKIREKLGLKDELASVYMTMGNTYANMEKNEEALKNYNLALKIREELKDKNGMASLYLGIGNIFISTNEFDKALKNLNASLKIKTELNEKNGIQNALNNIGIVNEMMGSYDTALANFYTSLKIAQELNDQNSISACYLNIAQAYTYLNKPKEAKEYYEKGLALAHQINDIQWLMEGYSGYSMLDTMTGNYRDALKNYQMYVAYRDSLNNRENTEKIVQIQMQYDFDKKQEEEKIIQAKKDQETSQAAFTQKIVIASVSLVLIMVLIFSVLLLKRIRLTRLQKQIIEEKNRDITDSINYAKRIQEVILPSLNIKNSLFKESFILFQPKDIVSGDFYWFAEKGDKRIIAAVDCTGHGVPGAFMSMIGNAFLNEIVNEKKITSPELILNELRNMIIHSLKQTGADGESRDGMDISILAFDDKNSMVEYAGANNPLWYIKDGLLLEIKADKRPIGYFRGQGLPFKLHKIPFKKGDSFYIFTDGFADQFGGSKGKKFKYSQLKEQLLLIQNKSMTEQEKVLQDTFVKWKDNLEQVDDVLVIGIKA